MKYLLWFIADQILEMKDAYDRLFKRYKGQPSLIINNIDWCTNSSWMERLTSYKQLELWTADK
jgi:calcineurin-like phosphoesterase family protein